MLGPEDAAEDVAYVMDFWRRFKLAQQREDGHLNAREFGQRVQSLPERRIQRFHSELLPCRAGDRLNNAAQSFLATISQYGFLVSCESRCALNNSGPYRLAEDREMIVRDFSDLAEGDYPWLDGVAGDIPFSNLTVTMEATGCHFYLMDDWGSFESKPEFTADKLTGVGLYTSDALSEGYVPVGMGSADELADTFEDLTERIRKATVELWKRMAGWTRDEMMDAGALVYFSMAKDFAHLAGVYEVNDWMTIDARADRFRSLFNDEFGRDFLGEMVGLVSLPSQQLHRYAMMQHNNNPVRYISQIPYSTLNRAGDAPRLAPIGPGVTHFGPKQDVYTTTAGRLTLADYNARAAAFRPAQMSDEYRFICDTTAKYAPDDPVVQALYRLEQAGSPLAGKGAGLARGDVESIRSARA